MSQRVICELCGRVVPAHANYVVKIEVFADPGMPSVTSEELEELDLDAKMKQLIEQMKHMTADELQDQVHRLFEYKICPPCHAKFLANPLGKPRERKSPTN